MTDRPEYCADERVVDIPVGPQHPALKEPETFTFEVSGETVINVKPRIGYAHRGIEKGFELRNHIQNLYLAERICGICSDSHTTCYAQSIEELLNLDIPRRAEYIRVIVAELERIHSHMLWLGIAAHEIGFETLFMHTWADREAVMDILELTTGNRVNYAINTIGGVRRDLDDGQIKKIQKNLDLLENRTGYYIETIPNESSVVTRTRDVGILEKREAIDLAAVGPTARASGVSLDVRRDDSYAAYDDITFDVITREKGDSLSRVIVRCLEVAESIKIIREAIDNLPEGDINVTAPRKVPEGEAVSRVEAPRGELIHYAVGNGTNKPERHKVRAPTLANIPALVKMLIGGQIADIPIVLAGIDPCFACMDRMAFVDQPTGRGWIWTMNELKREYSR